MAQALDIVVDVGSLLSVLGCLFVIFCHWKFKQLRTFANHLLFFVSISHCLSSIGDILHSDSTGTSNAACVTQELLLSFFQISTVFWSAMIAFTLNAVLLRELFSWNAININSKLVYMHSICWIYCTVFTILPFSTSSYGLIDDTDTCWIKNSRTIDHAWRFIQFYIPLWLSMFFSIYVFVSVWRKLKRLDANSFLLVEKNSVVASLHYYPLTLAVTFFSSFCESDVSIYFRRSS
eukprot:TRINITY_DN2126_c0_g1_i2.p1 TRINITY_DN2126_c0_g1~~TRINITY_DN2126_c0_g1_i2.p1  ORF type:complete len:235 (+),score=35.13 TRINITY_DN2126_c0_g1_i2:68-772(+)